MESAKPRRRPVEEVEEDLLFLVAEGYTNREIGIRLGRTPTAVKGLLQRTYLRLWIPNRVALANYARSRRPPGRERLHGYEARGYEAGGYEARGYKARA
jgi:DNA-binding CsgD family transcriptional regulator